MTYEKIFYDDHNNNNIDQEITIAKIFFRKRQAKKMRQYDGHVSLMLNKY